MLDFYQSTDDPHTMLCDYHEEDGFKDYLLTKNTTGTRKQPLKNDDSEVMKRLYCPKSELYATTSVFGTCVPTAMNAYRMNFFSDVFSAETTSTAFQRALWALYSELGDLVWTAAIALLFALLLFYAASFLPRVVLIVVIIFALFGSICCSGLLWWKFVQDKVIAAQRSNYMLDVPTDTINSDSFLALAILSTLCTLGVAVVLVIERSRLALAVGLIREAGRGLWACGVSLLLLPPIVWLLFVGFIALWIFVLGYIATTGTMNL
jgi:hypothetical protein